MPELMPVYDNLVDLGGGTDLVARLLSLYCPPPYLAGCSQVIWTKKQPTLIRNYDYSPYLAEAILLYSNWLRPVIAMSDCLWGVLDGMNDAGLAVSLSFGGRKITGEGFGIPLILRYVLETCDDTASAIKVLQRAPSHMAYNVSLVDATGTYSTVFLSPDASPIISEQKVSTNHQTHIEWEDYAKLSGTIERETFLEELIETKHQTVSKLIRQFLASPLYQTQWERGFGTLYTVAYSTQDKNIALHWPQKVLRQSFQSFEEGVMGIMFRNVRSYVE